MGETRRRASWVAVLSVVLIILAVVPSTAQDIHDAGIDTTPPPESGSGTITAHKFHDLNRDGVQSDNEPDVEGWLIRLYRYDSTGLYKVAEEKTGPDGTVTFPELVATRYKVWEQKKECWEPTTPPRMNYWDGGYYTVRDLDDDESLTVEFGNVYTCAPPPETCIRLKKTGPETAYPGDTITYHYWVHNCGDIILA